MKLPEWMEGIEPNWRILECIVGKQRAVELMAEWFAAHPESAPESEQ